MVEFLTVNWGELLIAVMALAKVIVNLTPTEADNKVFGWLDSIITYFIDDNRK